MCETIVFDHFPICELARGLVISHCASKNVWTTLKVGSRMCSTKYMEITWKKLWLKTT